MIRAMSDAETVLVTACPEAEVAEKRLTYVDQGDRAFILTRWGGEIRAFRNLCKHQFLVMEGCDVDDDSLQCPYHTVRYFLETGEVKDDSGFMGIEPLTRYPVRVEDGTVVIEVPASDRW